VVSTGAQRRDRLGFSTRRLRHLQFQPHSGRHRGNRILRRTTVASRTILRLERSIGIGRVARPPALV